ncbi:hypothetical protein OS493_014812 [Desmophyllum pertusum]|uniref:MANSC domain-containing protein n=1 Tax=Desmophyllum pertusum TaxID=174260 RepID=A0A9X0CH90_9CNID|nr:hypothetical protein OS493_014812 [Desmophyllum pertusum]
MADEVQTEQRRRPRPIKRRFNNRWRWLAWTPVRILKQLTMERRSAELRRIAAVIFLLINFGVIISESLVIDDPGSTVICIAGNTAYNETFEKDIGAGVFTALNEANSVRSCVRRACNKRAGDVAFLVEKNCYMVRCYSQSSCRTGGLQRRVCSRFTSRHTHGSMLLQFLPTSLMYSRSKKNNQRGQIIRNIYGQAKSRWSQNASIKYSIIRGNDGNASNSDPIPSGIARP